MAKAKKLNGQPAVMVPAPMLLELIRAFNKQPVEGRAYYPELQALEAKAYRKVRESSRAQS